jgi:hypothetical protein
MFNLVKYSLTEVEFLFLLKSLKKFLEMTVQHFDIEIICFFHFDSFDFH